MDRLQLTLSETVEELNRLVNHLDVMTRQAAEDEVEDLQASLEILAQLNSVKSRLGASYKSYEATLHTAMENQSVVRLDGGLVAERKGGTSRKQWDHQRLAKTVSERLVDMSVDMDTGEILKSTEEIITSLLQYAHVDYWRMKELTKLGIDGKKYSQDGQESKSIAIKREG